MSIWKKTATVEQLNAFCEDTIHEALDIRFTEVGANYLVATMPVEPRTRQPFGLLHGGASVVLAESLGSVASSLVVEEGRTCAGIEVNANHLRQVTQGVVTGRVSPVHLGKTLHVWEIRITDESAKLVCLSRLTVMVLPGKVPA